jgi:lauroyl/myristoyl acyltransferase
VSPVSLSRFFQSPFNAALFGMYPPWVTRCYTRRLGEVYFALRPGEKEKHLYRARKIVRRRKRGRICPVLFDRQILHGIFDHYFEKMLMAYWGLERISGFLGRNVRMVHADLLDQALTEGRGAILTTGHFGAVEFLPATLALSRYPVSMVVRYKTARLKKTLENIADTLRVELIDADEGLVIPRALAALRAGRLFIIELDEFDCWKATGGKVMKFFGRQIMLDRAVELLQRRSGAPVLLGLMERVGIRGYELVIESPSEHLPAPTGLGQDAQLLKRLEHYIYDRPGQWYIWNEIGSLGSLRPS